MKKHQLLGNYKIHSNIYNVIMGLVLKASQLLFPLITFPYITRILQPEGMGRASFAQSVIDIFSMLAMLGIPLYGIKACSRVRDDNTKLSTTVKELLIINSIAMIIAYCLLVISIRYIEEFKSEAVLISVLSLKMILTVFGVEWFYQSIEQYDYITIRSVLGKLFSIILMFIIVKDSNDIIQYGFILVIGTVGTNIFNILRLHNFVSFNNTNKINIKQHLSPILILFAFSATTTIYNSLSTVIIGFLSTNIEVGYYTTSIKIKTLLTGIITVASSVLLPRSSYLLHEKRHKEFLTLIQTTFNFNMLIAIPLSFFCILEADNIIKIIAGNQFINATISMQVIMPAVLFIGLTNVIGIQLFIPLNHENYVFISTLSGAVVNIIINFILIPLYGSLGAAIATVFTEFSVLFIQLIFAKHLKIKMLDIKEFIKIIVATFSALIVVYPIHSYVENVWLNIILCTSVFFLFILCMLLVFKEQMLQELKEKLLTRKTYLKL